MNRNASIYLDFIRFSAAMAVFLGHASNQHISGGLFWQLYPYLQTAVIVFFVLSGYVIAFVVDVREKDARKYLVSRACRMYSVVIPALILTVVCDSLGIWLDEASYREIVPKVGPHQEVNYVLSLFFVQNIWNLDFSPGTNGPFWSLTYEVFYYLLFGSLIFLRNSSRIITTLLLAVIAGPSVVSLFPVWFSGCLIYYVQKRGFVDCFPRYCSIMLSVVSLLMLLFFAPFFRENFLIDSLFFREDIVADYFDASMIFVHFLFFPVVLSELKVSKRIEKLVRWCSSLTFVIYLCHYPIIRFFSVLFENEPDSIERWILVFCVTPFVMIVMTPYTEKMKTFLKTCIENILARRNI